jgi:hypothetical protein
LPSGKQENFFNPTSIPSATQANLTSAKGWNQSPIKIAVGGPGAMGGGAGIGSGKGGNYVPSFIGSGKGEKKSNYTLFLSNHIYIYENT